MSRKSNFLLTVASISIAVVSLYLTGVLKPTPLGSQQSENDPKLPAQQNASQAIVRENTVRSEKANQIDVSRFPKASVKLPITSERQLFEEFSQSKDISAFVNHAKTIEGGQYFVRMALIYCGPLDAQGKVSAINKAQQEKKIDERIAAINSAFGACAKMPAGPELRAALKELSNSNDRSIALLETFGQHLAGNSEVTTAEFISRAISYGNPELLGQMLGVMVPSAQGNEKVNIVFNGNPITKEDSVALNTAMGLIACNYGLDCSGQSQVSTSQCALGGPCGIDEYEIVRRYNLTPVEWEKVVQFYSQTLEAYQSGNYGFVNVVKRKT